MKLMLLTDIHLSDRPPSSCTDTYTDDLFDLLYQARMLGVQMKIDAMVWAGDTFHLKAPSRVSHKLVHRVCTYIRDCLPDFPVMVLPGNHDIANDRLETILQTQPLGHLYRAGAWYLSGWAPDSYPVYGVPWLQGYGSLDDQEKLEAQHSVVEASLAKYREKVFEHGTGAEHPLVVTHAPLYPPGKELGYECFPVEWWWQAMGSSRGGVHNVFYGHVHEPHSSYGLYDENGGITFCNNGALSRGSLHEYNLTRQVGVTLYDTLTGRFEFVPLSAKPASEVFRLQEKQQVTDMNGRLDDFLAGVGAASLEVMNAESVIEHIRTLGVGKPVEDLAEELITEALHAKGK